MLPLVVVPAAFVAALPWLKAIGRPAALLVAATVGAFVMSYASYIAFRALRRLDEVQKAGMEFAAQWGAPVGQAVFVALLIMPPFADLASAMVGRIAAHPGMVVDRAVVVVAMGLGFIGTVLLQGVGSIVVQAMWWAGKR
jgi:hypothetical protein